ncbi:3-hydroxyacyl-CoA dehydrogenase family protein [Pseudomonas sp. Leaf129]|uniref:3-hydroxyacyl-CoA dehydrogenase family protein n=1 Tax=Pseudomonas sp. Leaf129 TaxID=1736268 RepID=UPI0009EA82DF|nr:3-hydroxyacyl-CoA dehydrogenase family protein [Pseudomonas sp. Leaf129]
MDTSTKTAFASTAILGAGLMGVGIALHLARHGCEVRLYDPQPERLAEIPAVASAILNELAAADQFDEADRDVTLSRLIPVSTLTELADLDLLIEAVPERLPLKQSLYRELEGIVRPDCVFASNTSGLPPDSLAEGLKYPARLFIAHFWNPPHFIPLVELVPGTATDAHLVEKVRAMLEAMDLEAVVLEKAAPGFIGNRLQFALLREALHIVQSGIADADTVDRVMRASLGRRYGMVGPLEAADMAGLDTFVDISTHLMPQLAQGTDVIELLKEKVAASHTGLRSGQGFYRWDEARNERLLSRRGHQLRFALKP